jgi:hypothetical protein
MIWFLFGGGVDWLVEAHLRDVFECRYSTPSAMAGGIWVGD